MNEPHITPNPSTGMHGAQWCTLLKYSTGTGMAKERYSSTGAKEAKKRSVNTSMSGRIVDTLATKFISCGPLSVISRGPFDMSLDTG